MAPSGKKPATPMEALDAFQLNQILTLGMDDMLFRAQLRRGAGEAAASARGFVSERTGRAYPRPTCAPTCCLTALEHFAAHCE